MRRHIGPRVHSCCFCIPSRIGVYIIVSVALVGALSNMSRMLALTNMVPWKRYSSMGASGIVCVISALLLTGVLKDTPVLIIPWLVVQAVAMVIYVLALAVFTATAGNNIEIDSDQFSIVIASALIFLGLWIYSWVIVQNVYTDIKISNEGPEVVDGFDPSVGRGPVDENVVTAVQVRDPYLNGGRGRSNGRPGGGAQGQAINPFSGEPVKHPAVCYEGEGAKSLV